ncbi:hypothetical protein DNTS_035750 [Danionella cerebrum]|uniref:BHLH domain-containing protein n=1 Tax=Danionella cerebrum TaxID=2873325 RepID=A0A553Q3A0_9TELE|nr:hypothetical protein DNTS_035750 [Danionella translucida]
MTKAEGVQRRLKKPVIEKKRRDRINHNLKVLRDLLFKNTADSRLQNPKMEKAEILDLAVEYIKTTKAKDETKWTFPQIDSKVSPRQSAVPSSNSSLASDFCGSFKPSEQEIGVNNICSKCKPGPKPGFFLSSTSMSYQHGLLLHPEPSLYGSPFLCQAVSPPLSSSTASQYSSPPTSPDFTSAASSPSASPQCPSISSPPSPEVMSDLKAALSLETPILVSQHTIASMRKDVTPVALRQELFPNKSAWRPWS